LQAKISDKILKSLHTYLFTLFFEIISSVLTTGPYFGRRQTTVFTFGIMLVLKGNVSAKSLLLTS